MEERVVIVDRDDQVIGDLPRSQVAPQTYYRISSLIVYNDKGEILLGKRASTKAKNPDKWAPLVNGTNALGETYESNIEKEAMEEIQFKLSEYWTVDTIRVEENFNYFVRYFATIITDTSMLFLDPNEMSEMKWFTVQELENELEANSDSFVPKFKEYILPIIKKGIPKD